ncbi:hypothetical protein BC830DRAFT_526343 [Chytriomyces sp. MP71]|nr:hypothetical protein BC830DRAFT_526343 [Chytriomyces sp. MP71]
MEASQLCVTAGVSVGPFALGQSLNAATAALRTLAATFHARDGTECAVKLVVDQKNPATTDILLIAPWLGLCCRFDPKDQTLRLIELYSLNAHSLPLAISVGGHELASPRAIPTLQAVFKRLGPTYPGCHIPEKNEFCLGYPGLALLFPIPPTSTLSDTHATVSTDLLLTTAKTQPVASRLYVFNPTANATAITPDFLSLAHPPLLSSRAAALLHALPGRGISLPHSGANLSFGASAQDVLAALGPASDIYLASARDNVIPTGAVASPSNVSTSQEIKESAIWNYFHLGLDVVMDANTGNSVIERFVLHTNLPMHYSFGRYVRCRFRMLLNHDGDRGHLIDASSSWSSVQKLLGPPPSHMVYNKAMGSSPFGGSEYFGYEGLIFEVVDGNHVASIVMFRV